MAKYNGYRNYNHWNVSLWLNNDPMLYETARMFKRQCRSSHAAASAMLNSLHDDFKITHTPDGVRYTVTTLKVAMAHL